MERDFVDIEGDKKPKPRNLTHENAVGRQGPYIAAEMDEPHLWGR